MIDPEDGYDDRCDDVLGDEGDRPPHVGISYTLDSLHDVVGEMLKARDFLEAVGRIDLGAEITVSGPFGRFLAADLGLGRDFQVAVVRGVDARFHELAIEFIETADQFRTLWNSIRIAAEEGCHDGGPGVPEDAAP